MPYLERTDDVLVVDCACRCAELNRRVELNLFQIELRPHDTVVLRNTVALPIRCWATLTHINALKQLWYDTEGVSLYVVDPPWIFFVVATTLDLVVTKTCDAPPIAPDASRGVVCIQVRRHGGEEADGGNAAGGGRGVHGN